MDHSNPIEPGMPAPDFELEDEDGHKVRLSTLRGEPVVLVFYPFDWSGLCTAELCDLRDAAPSWEGSGARVFGISRDSKYSHKAWKEHLGLKHSLLADLTGDVARQYGAWNEERHRADRKTVAIDPTGMIRYVRHNDSGMKRDHSEALEAVREMTAGARQRV